MSHSRFEGRIAVVTGAGTGIGRAIALRFASAGAVVGVTGRTMSTLAETVSMVQEAGGQAFAVAGDVTSEASMRDVAARFTDKLGPVTLLVNNAGGGLETSFGGPGEAWHEQVSRNLTSVAIVSGAFWGTMTDAGGGVVVNLGSISGRLPVAGIAGYCAAKAGVEVLTASLALEGAPHKIRAVCVVPGAVLTPTLEEWVNTFEDPAAKFAELSASSILGRLGTPEDVAEAVAFLASDAASYITGTTLLIDGGQSIGRT